MDSICVVCNKAIKNKGRLLGTKGRSTVIECSRKRHDELHDRLSSLADDCFYVHDACYKEYTHKRNISSAHSSTQGSSSGAVHTRTSHAQHYDYPTHCLICAQQIDFEASRRNPGRVSQISSIEYVSNKDKRSIIQDTLTEVCSKREDVQAMDVNARIEFAGDLRAVEAKYHRTCMQEFMSYTTVALSDAVPKENVRNLNTLNATAFQDLCNWFKESEQQDRQFTLVDLKTQLDSYLPVDVPSYSTRHIKRRLLERFGDDLTVSELDGKTNVVTLKERAETILHESYVAAAVDEDSDIENIRLARSVGSIIKQDIQNIEQSTDVYPTPSDVAIDKLEATVPDTLKEVIKALFSESRSASAKQKKLLLRTALCHAVMHAVSDQTYISPLMLSVGLFIHQSTRSRVLLDVLSSLGLSASYTQVMSFERSAVINHSVNELPPGLVAADDGGGFCQWIADNFDYNEDTLAGHDTTHVMGIIACQTPQSIDERGQAIQRKNVTAEEIVHAGQFGDIIRPYKPRSKNVMADIQITPVNPSQWHISITNTWTHYGCTLVNCTNNRQAGKALCPTWLPVRVNAQPSYTTP